MCLVKEVRGRRLQAVCFINVVQFDTVSQHGNYGKDCIVILRVSLNYEITSCLACLHVLFSELGGYFRCEGVLL
jgi:hypothetical protein